MTSEIKSIEKGWGESSTYYRVVNTTVHPSDVHEIREEERIIGQGEYGPITILVYRGYVKTENENKLIFEIGANRDITLTYK